jgi:ADP-ribose pyrophosphatase
MADVHPWELLAQRPGPGGWIEVVTKTYRMPDGSVVDWDVMVTRDSVAVLALTEDDQVVLARQFRPGPACVLDELPGGELDDGEAPLEAAVRELAEETGYVGEMTLLAHSWQGANITRRRWAAVATGCRRVRHPRTDPSEEFCDTVTVSLAEFRERLRGGQLTDGWAGYAGLAYLGLLTTPSGAPPAP